MVQGTNDFLQNTTETGHPPKRRIKNAEAAWDIYDELKDASDERSRQWARIKGMYDRNPPHSVAELKRLGRSWQTNVNTAEMEAIIDTNAAAAHEAVFEVQALITAKIRPEFKPRDRSLNYEQIIADEYSEMVNEWDGFHPNCDLATKHSFLYGMGGMLWRDEFDWRPRAYRSSSFLFPERSSTDLEELEVFGVRDEIPVRWLFETIEDPDIATDAGWDVAFVRKIIVRTYGLKAEGEAETDPYQTSDWESTQSSIRNNATDAESRDFAGVRVVHIIVKEVHDGSISHMIIPEDFTDEQGFLFESLGRFESMDQLLWLLPFDNGDGMIRSVKGVGHRAFMHCDLSNRLFGAIMDGGQFSASLLVQPNSGADLSRIQLVKLGGMLVVPPEFNVIQQSFTPPIQHLIPLRQMSSELLNNNLGVFRPRTEDPGVDKPREKTATQVRSEESKEARFSKNQALARYLAWDKWHREVYRRVTRPEYLANGYDSIDALLALLQEVPDLNVVFQQKTSKLEFYPGQKLAIRFFAACLRRRVPPHLLLTPGAIRVSATRAIGLGSDSAKRQALVAMMQDRGAQDDISRRNTEREWAASQLGGYRNVDKFYPVKDASQVPTSETGFATLENNDMAEGSQLPVGSDQLHGIHIPVHFSAVIPLARNFLQSPGSIDLAKSLQLFKVMIPHLGAHVRHLANDPTRKKQVKGYVEAIKQLIQVFQKMQALVQKAQGVVQQQQAQQQSEQEELRRRADENERKLVVEKYRIDREMELRRLDTESLNETRLAKLRVSMEAELRKMFSEIQNESAKTQAKITNEQALTQSKLASAST